MRKFLSPIINLLSLILVGIAYGLAGITAAHNVNDTSIGNYYQIVWQNPNSFSVAGFFIIIIATVFVIALFIPKLYKITGAVTFTGTIAAGLLITGGVFALLTPAKLQEGHALPVTNQPGLIGLAVLLFVAAFLTLIIVCLEFLPEEK